MHYCLAMRLWRSLRDKHLQQLIAAMEPSPCLSAWLRSSIARAVVHAMAIASVKANDHEKSLTFSIKVRSLRALLVVVVEDLPS